MSAFSKQTSIFEPTLPLKAGNELLWRGLYGSSFGLAVVSAARRHAGPVVIACADNRRSQALEDEIRFYLGGEDGLPLLPYPDWECLVYDRFSPHQDIVSRRLKTLSMLPTLEHGIIVLSVPNLMQRTAPREYIAAHSFSLAVGDQLDIDELRQQLETAAYRHVGQVFEHGEYAVRGGIVDLYPMGSGRPYRIDLFGDEVDSIRHFDPETQLSSDQVERIELLPAREFPMTDAGIRQFRHAWREQFEGDPRSSVIYNEVSDGHIPPGTEFYMPLFFEQTGLLTDLLPESALIVLDQDSRRAAMQFQSEVVERFEQASLDIERPPLPPERLYIQPEELENRLKRFLVVEHAEIDKDPNRRIITFPTRRPDNLPVDIHADDAYRKLFDHLHDSNDRILLVAETTGRRENLKQILNNAGIYPETIETADEFFADEGIDIALTQAPLERGLALTDPAIQVISESQLYGDKVFQRRARSKPARDPEAIIRSMADLNIGDPVIHEIHGVGRYMGLTTLNIDQADTEFLTLEYQDGDKLYVPVMSLHLVSRYSGLSPESAPLHRLGGKEWEKTRRKARQRAYDAAVELLAVQALRDSRTGHAFPPPDRNYDRFAAAFPFEETPDQAKAIDDVIADMVADKPMDRLVCGDVGFGKTEVALRAAFLAINGGTQVAIVVPTTLLAQQHYETFRDRFADLPVRIDVLSRFRTAKESAAILAGLADGGIDIIIGTHRLLQKDIRFKHLGLMIIDEEQRFGVRHKEVLKKKRSQVDILTLTATPIPRTLNLSLSGLRDISIIATPPRARLTIRTFVAEWSESLIHEGFQREIRRGGQVYFLHNEVRTMPAMQAKLEAIIPEARIRMAHGQMPERELEHIMQDFYHQRFNVLLCSTIIESGIDIPSANTIFINQGDRFGLAQMHQLRGRVGRSHHQAYCYVMIQSRRSITADAQRRLDALETLDELGSGFALAMSDMEIRGTGELLGESQSGVIDEVGFTMYTELLNRAIRSLKNGKEITPEDIEVEEVGGVEIDLSTPALLPEDYLPDVHTRLIMYKRIANARDANELYELQIEMIDRFGLLPDQAKTLFALSELKLQAGELGISEIRMGESGGRISFVERPNIDPMGIIKLIQSQSDRYRMEGPQVLHILAEIENTEQRIAFIKSLLDELATHKIE